jgi:hypothetical protein
MHLYSVEDAIKLYWDEYSPGQTFPSVEADSGTADLLQSSPNNTNAKQDPPPDCISQHDWNSRLSRQLIVLQRCCSKTWVVDTDQAITGSDRRGVFDRFLDKLLIEIGAGGPPSSRHCSCIAPEVSVICHSQLHIPAPTLFAVRVRFRLLVHNRQVINIVFRLPRSVRRFEQRLRLFINDLDAWAQKKAQPIQLIQEWIRSHREAQGEIFCEFAPLISAIKAYVEQRDDTVFATPTSAILYFTASLGSLGLGRHLFEHLAEIWHRTSAMVLEAVWQALEDLVDHAQDVRDSIELLPDDY